MHNQIKIQEHNKEMNSSLHENIYRFSKNRSSDRWVSEVRVVHHQITWNLGPYACNCKAQKARIYKCKRSVTIKDPIVVWPRTQCGNQKPIEISAPLLLIRGRERTGKLGPEHYLENMLCFGLTHLSISLSLSLYGASIPFFKLTLSRYCTWKAVRLFSFSSFFFFFFCWELGRTKLHLCVVERAYRKMDETQTWEQEVQPTK